jgi:hypothetical protein
MTMRLLILLGMLLGLAGPAASHALQPRFLNLEALGGDAWQVFWKVPTDGTGPMAIAAVLPERCVPDRRMFTPKPRRWSGAVGGAMVAEEGLEPPTRGL